MSNFKLEKTCSPIFSFYRWRNEPREISAFQLNNCQSAVLSYWLTFLAKFIYLFYIFWGHCREIKKQIWAEIYPWTFHLEVIMDCHRLSFLFDPLSTARQAIKQVNKQKIPCHNLALLFIVHMSSAMKSLHTRWPVALDHLSSKQQRLSLKSRLRTSPRWETVLAPLDPSQYGSSILSHMLWQIL